MPENVSANSKDLLEKLLQKNPSKRLGSGKKDSEEIKSHPLFAHLDWDMVLQRKLDLPKPEGVLNMPVMEFASKQLFYESATGDSEGRIEGWSFVNTVSAKQN